MIPQAIRTFTVLYNGGTGKVPAATAAAVPPVTPAQTAAAATKTPLSLTD